MPETGEGTADKKTKNKKQNDSGMPKHARAGLVWVVLPLHGSPPPALAEHTTVDVYSSTYHTTAHALVQSLFLCCAGMCIAEHALVQSLFLCCAGMYIAAHALVEVIQCWYSHFFLRFSAIWGERAMRPPDGASPRLPLAEMGISGNSFAGDTEG